MGGPGARLDGTGCCRLEGEDARTGDARTGDVKPARLAPDPDDPTSESSSLSSSPSPAPPERRSCLDALQAWIKSYTLGRAVYAGMALLPILDMISDVALITYFYLPSGYWKSALVVWYIIYQSLRFITCYAPLHPKPSWRTLFLLYVPGLLLPYYAEMLTTGGGEARTGC